VTRSEVAVLAEWQRQADRMRVFEEVSMWAKLVAKLAQAFLFSAAIFAEGVARVARIAAAEKAAIDRVESFNKLGGTIEKWVDMLDLAVRGVILFLFEFTRLGILFVAAPMRIGGLLGVSRGALR
jgi:hypothetical protein